MTTDGDENGDKWKQKGLVTFTHNVWMDRSLKLQKCYECESPTHCSNVDLYQK